MTCLPHGGEGDEAEPVSTTQALGEEGEQPEDTWDTEPEPLVITDSVGEDGDEPEPDSSAAPSDQGIWAGEDGNGGGCVVDEDDAAEPEEREPADAEEPVELDEPPELLVSSRNGAQRGAAAVTPGIIGPEGDPQVTAVADQLRRHGHEPVVLDLSRFPRELGLSVRDGVASARHLDFASVGSWYVRSLPLPLPFRVPQPPGPDGERTGRLRYAAGRERRSFLAGFVSALPAAVFVNPPAAMTQHFRKLEQLDALRRADVPVPTTLASNDPEVVRDFAHEAGALVYKPLAGGGRCRRLSAADLEPDRLRLLAGAPALFQEEVPGANIRVYVVGDRVAAAYEIVSEELDYRGAEDTVVPTTLGAGEHDACLRAAAACDMTFTGIDLRRRPDGGFAVLECNPSPMFAGIERWTGLDPVSRALTDLLVGASESMRMSM